MPAEEQILCPSAQVLYSHPELEQRTLHILSQWYFVNDDSYVDNQMDFFDKITDLIGDGLID